jgi:hypothetical protein
MKARFPSVRILFSSALFALAAAAEAREPGPGPSHERYDAADLFKPLSIFHSPEGTSWGNGVFYNGYLLMGVDVDEDSSGFQFWDISDPRNPKLAAQKYDAETKRLREIQNFSWAFGYGKDLAAIPSHEGVEIWDFTDIHAAHRFSSVDLAHGGGRAIYNGIISAFWQPPYIYCGGMDGGIYIVDANDPAKPRLVKNIPNSALSGRLAGPIFALGNLLVATTMEFAYENCAITTFDLADPEDPQIADRYSCGTHEGNYTQFMNGNRIYGMGAQGRLLVYEVSQSFEVNKHGQDTVWEDHGGYGMYQDGYVHAGMSDWYIKYDVAGFIPKSVGRYHVHGDNDWALPIGNVVFVGDDDGPTSEGALVPHQAGPDTLGPVVNWTQPIPNSVNVDPATRIGLSFSDNIDFASLDSNTVVFRPVGGEPIPGKLSVLAALLNFTPDRPLEPRTEYEILLRAGGLRDWGGVPSPRDTVIRFTTGVAASIARAGRSGAQSRRDYRLLMPAQGASTGAAALPPWPGLRNPLGRAVFPAAPARDRIRIAPGLYILPEVR